MNKLRQATRKTIIEDVRILHIRRGEPFFPPDIYLEENEHGEAEEAWQIFTTTRDGMKPAKTKLFYVFSEEEANVYHAKYPIGSELSEQLLSKQTSRHLIRQIMSAPSLGFGVASGDSEEPLAFDVLGDAGIYQERYGPLSKEVIENIGHERVAELKETFGENWNIAAAFEYCWVELPHSSPAFVAASYQYHYYITEDDFSAGYHWRDLEVLVDEVEETARKAIETRKRAGKTGSKKSMQAREARRDGLMEALEVVAKRNPDLMKLGEVSVAKLAMSEAVEAAPTLWRQGQGQVREYLGEIRRGEAGEAMKARYLALFPAKPPKRFSEF